MRILVTAPLFEAWIRPLLESRHTVLPPPFPRALTREELLEYSTGVDALLGNGGDRIDGALLDARPSIRFVALNSAGYDHVDVPACTARGVGVTNAPGVLTNTTAELAFGLMLAAARRMGEAERYVRSGGWASQSKGSGTVHMGTDVVGQTLGIVGAGRIGSRLARMALGFDMTLLYHNRNRSADMDALGATLVPLDELLRQADFVSLHVPLNPETRHLIGARELGLMKPTAVLINAARGPLVDEGALVEALRERRIIAAGLDVYEREPQLHPGLPALENVVLLPHIGSATTRTRAAMARTSVTNLLAMLDGKRPPNPVNGEVWATGSQSTNP
jgi:glyoxylate reductase